MAMVDELNEGACFGSRREIVHALFGGAVGPVHRLALQNIAPRSHATEESVYSTEKHDTNKTAKITWEIFSYARP